MAIELIEEDESFEYQLPGTESKHGPSILYLRRLTSDEQREIFRRHTKRTFHKGQRFEDTDYPAVVTDALKIGIVGWSNVRSKTSEKEIPFDPELTKALPRSDREHIFGVICDVPDLQEDGLDPFGGSSPTSGGLSRSEKQPQDSIAERVTE